MYTIESYLMYWLNFVFSLIRFIFLKSEIRATFMQSLTSKFCPSFLSVHPWSYLNFPQKQLVTFSAAPTLNTPPTSLPWVSTLFQPNLRTWFQLALFPFSSNAVLFSSVVLWGFPVQKILQRKYYHLPLKITVSIEISSQTFSSETFKFGLALIQQPINVWKVIPKVTGNSFKLSCHTL